MLKVILINETSKVDITVWKNKTAELIYIYGTY